LYLLIKHFIIIISAFLFTVQIIAQHISLPENDSEKVRKENSTDTEPDFILIGLPDTQYYSENKQSSGSGKGTGDIADFIGQTDWIVSNRVASNIVYVVHLGDCVENADDSTEWIRAEDAMDNLEAPVTTLLADGIPYGIAVGNHDQYPEGEAGIGSSTTALFNQYFGVSRFSGRNYYGGHYGSNNDNHFDLFTVGSLKFVVVYVEYHAYTDDTSAVNWADGILAAYGDRHGILVSHKLLGSDGLFSSAGNYIYPRVRDNANLFLMLAGHVTTPGEARLTEERGGDSVDVVTLMSDYQAWENGGDGWLRIMRFSEADKKIYVSTYSPKLDSNMTNSESQFVFDYGFTNPPLPVELEFFSGTQIGRNVELQWRTETEINNYGFNIERNIDNAQWLTMGFVEGHGNSNSPKGYSFTDFDVRGSGSYQYRLKQIDNDGTIEYSNIITIGIELPFEFELSQNYPNPFNPSTIIDFTIPEKQVITLKIYNVIGEQVAELIHEELPAGRHSVPFNASDLAGGVYIYRLESQKFASNKKMTLLK
jgi:hypothetical protein